MKRWLLAAACGVMAAGLLLYPLIGELVSEKYHSDVETTYTAAIEDTDDAELTAQRQAAEQYNAMLSGTAAITEGGADAPPLAYAEQLTVGGVMCYIDIPKIGVYLPVQHGTSAETLERAVGHVVGTSLPVGGSSTHAVLSAHSGMASSKLFSDIEQLKLGDTFFVHVLGDTLAYEVDTINTVLPTDTSLLQIEEGKDLVTLVTCTPFGINTHRLLVRGHRVPYTLKQEVSAAEEKPVASSWTQHYLTGLGMGLGAVAVVGGAYFLVRRGAMRKTPFVLAALLAVAGICVMLWPVFTGHRLQAGTDAAVREFFADRDVPEQQYPELLTALQEYNRQLYTEKQCNLTDLEACEAPAADLAAYGIEDEIIGVLEIPTMELTMPVYLGASDAHLAAGAAVLGNTSAPVGGNNTNSVIAGHRGWRGADYFRHIDRLQVGDTVKLTNLWVTLTYTVANIQIIQPHEVEKIKIQQGRDLLTLVTCHPYASGGKQRYVVYCERTEVR